MTTQTRPRPVRPPVETGVAAAVRRHPMVTFFVLACGLSWISWLPYILSTSGLGVLDISFTPVLGTTQFMGMLPGAYLGPIFSAFLVTWIADGRAGLRVWLSRMWRWRVDWRWYAIALLGVPAGMLATGFVFTGVAGGRVLAPTVSVVIAYVPLLLVQMLTTGLAEEPGWRDFALPRLQRRFGALGSAAILGPVWALWHLPLFFTEWGGWPETTWTRVGAFIVFCVSFNVVITWVFNRTGGSLPLAVLAHVSVNNVSSVVWDAMFPDMDADLVMVGLAAGSVVAAVALLAATRGRLGYRACAGRSLGSRHE